MVDHVIGHFMGSGLTIPREGKRGGEGARGGERGRGEKRGEERVRHDTWRKEGLIGFTSRVDEHG